MWMNSEKYGERNMKMWMQKVKTMVKDMEIRIEFVAVWVRG